MDQSNFFLEMEDNMCIFNFKDVGLLPEFFANNTIPDMSKPFTSEVTCRYLD